MPPTKLDVPLPTKLDVPLPTKLDVPPPTKLDVPLPTKLDVPLPTKLDMPLLKEMVAKKPLQNHVTSPFLISMLMSQVWLGARGTTRDEVGTKSTCLVKVPKSIYLVCS